VTEYRTILDRFAGALNEYFDHYVHQGCIPVSFLRYLRSIRILDDINKAGVRKYDNQAGESPHRICGAVQDFSKKAEKLKEQKKSGKDKKCLDLITKTKILNQNPL
jgi:hypothetical protein